MQKMIRNIKKKANQIIFLGYITVLLHCFSLPYATAPFLIYSVKLRIVLHRIVLILRETSHRNEL